MNSRLRFRRTFASSHRTNGKVILNFLQNILEPRASGKPLKGDKRNLWRYRVGRYRVICDLQDRRTAILVLKVSHRKEAYR